MGCLFKERLLTHLENLKILNFINVQRTLNWTFEITGIVGGFTINYCKPLSYPELCENVADPGGSGPPIRPEGFFAFTII